MEENINRNKKLQISIVYFCIFILTLNLFFSTTGIQLFNTDIVRFVVIVILVLAFFTVDLIKVSIFDIIIVPICITYYYVFSQSVALNILVLYLISFYLKNDRLNHIKKTFLKILITVNILWLILLIAQILPNNISTDFGRTRYYLGFKNINQSSLFYFPFLLLTYDKYKDKIIIKLGICLLSIFFFYLTDTRSAFYAFICFILITWLFKRFDNIREFISQLFIFLITVITGFFLFAGKVIQVFPFINQLLTNRMSIIAQGMSSFTIKNYIIGMNEQLLDNSYIMLFSTFGLVGFLFWLLMLRKVLINSEFSEWRFIITILVYGFFESTLFIPESIVAIFFFIILQKQIREVEFPSVYESK
ncbi:TPA: hypothetical protein ACIEC0_000530 [Enterococcus faecium]|uniref:hypothetical protein n=3 Tax=Enterococcus faecium TaxID=1352 RepID=UPI003557D831